MAQNSFLTRLIMVPIVMVLTTIVMFALPELQGVDQASATLRARTDGASLDQETLDGLERELGLDRPVHEQYFDYLGRLATGDFGESNISRRPVRPQVVDAAKTSATLIGVAMTISVVAAVAIGVTAAAKPFGLFDKFTTATSRIWVSIPSHVSAPVLVYFFGVRQQWLPTSGWGDYSHMVLPVFALAVGPTALFSQVVRAETAQALQQPYVRTAKAKGVRRWKIVWVHAARMSANGVLALGGMFAAGLFGGSVIVEVVFGIPGIGRLLHDAVKDSDVPMLQAGGLVVVAAGLVIGAVSDYVSSLLSPPTGE